MPIDHARRIYELEVHMDDGRPPFRVETDQRDTAAFELEPFGLPRHRAHERLETYLRWTAWNALRRRNKTTSGWPKWNGECLFVQDVSTPAPAADGDDPLDPGQQDQPEGP